MAVRPLAVLFNICEIYKIVSDRLKGWPHCGLALGIWQYPSLERWTPNPTSGDFSIFRAALSNYWLETCKIMNQCIIDQISIIGSIEIKTLFQKSIMIGNNLTCEFTILEYCSFLLYY